MPNMNWAPSSKKWAKEQKKKSGTDLVEQNVLDKYLSSLRNYPLLPHPETVELFKRYNELITRDEEGEVIERPTAALKIRNKLTESNLRLVVSLAKIHRGQNLPLEELIQEGNIGLMKAVDRFKHEKGFRFSTYATWWIRQSIGQFILKRKNTIRMPAHAKTVQRKMMQAAAEYREVMGCEPTTEELTALVGASSTVVKATMHAGRGTVSLQQPLGSSGEGDTIEDRIEDDRAGADPFQNVAEKQLLGIVQNVIADLSPKEAAILRLRFGLVEDCNSAADYPITEEEARGVMEGRGLT
jgi:RNA polymerase primary sigma factor